MVPGSAGAQPRFDVVELDKVIRAVYIQPHPTQQDAFFSTAMCEALPWAVHAGSDLFVWVGKFASRQLCLAGLGDTRACLPSACALMQFCIADYLWQHVV